MIQPRSGILLTCALLLGLARLGIAAEPPRPMPAEALKEANKLLAEDKLGEAEAAFHRAEALADGPCGGCMLGLATVRAFEGRWDEAAAMTESSLPLLTDAIWLARAYNQLGLAYASGAGGKDRLAKAEEAARKAVGYGGVWGAVARRNLAQILFLEKRWADSVQVAREALAEAETDKTAANGARITLCQARYHLPEDEPEPDRSKLKKPATPLEVSRPVKIAGPNPEYTGAAKLHNTQGIVVLDSVIDREGCVRHLKATTRLPNGLTDAALAAVRQWVFSPAVYQGKPAPVFYTLTVRFGTSGGPPDPEPVPVLVPG